VGQPLHPVPRRDGNYYGSASGTVMIDLRGWINGFTGTIATYDEDMDCGDGPPPEGFKFQQTSDGSLISSGSDAPECGYSYCENVRSWNIVLRPVSG
jgi:hypothetical protein